MTASVEHGWGHKSLVSRIIVAFFVFSLPSAQTVKPSTATEGTRASTTAFQKYYAKMVESPSHVLELDDSKFDAMLIKPGQKRSFPVVILFTAANPKYGCQACHIVGNEFEGMANTYLQRNARRPSDNQLPPLIFARADVETAPAVVHEKFQLQTVPHLFFFPAHQALSLPARNLDELSVTSGGTAIAEELEDRIGLTLKRVPNVRATVKGAVLFAVLAAVAAYFLMDQWSWTKTLPFRRPLWLCFSYLVFAIATGGMIYCIIRRPPPFGITQQKVKLISTRDTSDMFVFEGLLMGFLQLAAGLAFVLTYFFASRRRQTLLQWIGINLSLAAALYFLHQIFGFYSEKARWYRIQHIVDPMMANFLFGNMKKGSGLFRRLVRLTQLWLYEFKDLVSFRRSAMSYLGKYIKRLGK
ncbi:Oligosaccharyl transferase complex, subunit OST3/OST6 [Nannochloropsis gaditana]|uniref:Oligosaccharyl transferase complex, subunit OST3/OST6 n=1 Tax=Nannochloropsis gaditana TaxID=72520 RepID=W7TWI3_9STRA|nr:Oligosaccharyl transferase complex, subunit OST3/OST6 [Nannochloropsis gaditana]